MNIQEFTSSGTFIAPAGVTRVLVLACAGGAGGCSGSNTASVVPGMTLQGLTFLLSLKMIDITPNTSYTITIGTGGTGAASNTAFTKGGVGTSTSFGYTTWGASDSTSPNLTNSINSIQQGGQARDQSNGVFASGSNGAASGSYFGGAGTPGTSFAAGVTGGAGNNAGAGSTGSNATSAGGSGANGGSGSTTGGAGGNGYKGYLVVMWSE